jgi:glycerol-1-phosphate dehydrogenase [NAD(P)+]
MNARLAAIWPELRAECQAFMLPVERMEAALRDAGGAVTGHALGLDSAFYREAVVHAREIRNRLSVLDVLADAGELEAAVAGER